MEELQRPAAQFSLIGGKSKGPIHLEASERIRRMIIEKSLRVGDALPPYHELVKLVGVCRVTVKRAVDTLAREGLLTVIHGKGTFVSRLPEPGPRELKRLTLVFAPSRLLLLQQEYLREVFQGILAMCDGYRIGLQIHSVYSAGAPLAAHEVADSSDAVIVLGRLSESHIAQLLRQRIPVAIVDYLTEGQPTDHLLCNNIKGVEMMLDHLMGLGHRRICYASPNSNEVGRTDPDQIEREDGYVAMMKVRGLAPDVFRYHAHPDESSKVAALLARASRPDHPTAWLTADHILGGLICTNLEGAGYRVPQDVAVAAVATAGSVHEVATGMITACVFPFDEMGRSAVVLLHDRCWKPQPAKRVIHRFDPVLRVGGSTVAELEGRPRWPQTAGV
jgi:DNA-binding LacI/PurR family transcriptional regulator/DNA-binding transcriptional regulator YhcF (GntR family)